MTANRRFNLNQRTPLTVVYMTGYESTIASLGGSTDATYNTRRVTTTPHLIAGNGGAAHYSPASNQTYYGAPFEPLIEWLVFIAHKTTWSSSSSSYNLFSLTNTINADTYGIRLYVDNATIALDRNGTSIGTPAHVTLSSGEFYWWGLRWYSANAGGKAQIRLSHYDNLLVDFTGDTRTTSERSNSMYYNSAVSTGHTFDEIIVCGRTIYYTAGAGGTGTPTLGNTLSSGGNTCVISSYYDNGAGVGVIFIHNLSGTFAINDTISDGSGWTANCENIMNDTEACLWLPEQVIVQKLPTSDVAAGWSSTAANGYSVLDDQGTTTDYISTNTAATVNEHAQSVTLPTNAQVYAIQTMAHARHNGSTGVSRIRLGYDDGTANVDADYDQYLPTNFYALFYIWTYNSRTYARFTKAQVDAMNIRVTSVA